MTRPFRDKSTSDLALALGVSDRQVRRWLEKGCPSGQKKRTAGGRPFRVFDIREVKLWLAGEGIAPKTLPGAKKKAKPNAKTKDKTPAKSSAKKKSAKGKIATVARKTAKVADKDADTNGATNDEKGGHNGDNQIDIKNIEAGYEAMLERFRESEKAAYIRWADCINNPTFEDERDPIAEAAALAKGWTTISEQLRKLEKDAESIRQHDAGWIKASEIQDSFTKIATEIKTALLAVPQAVAPVCEGRTAAEIEAIVKSEVIGVLKLLASGDKPKRKKKRSA